MEKISRAREKQEVQKAIQLDLPVVVGEPIPILYVQMDGTVVPVVKKETAGRKGKVEGQPAHTREAKLGCVFTQTTWDKEGYAIRDPDSTTYTGAIQMAEEFGPRLYLEACKHGWSRAKLKVVTGSGAEWIWSVANEQFPGAIQIVGLIMPPASLGLGASYIPTTMPDGKPGSKSIRSACSIKGKSKTRHLAARHRWR